MTALPNRPTPSGLAANVALAVGLVLALNGLVFAFGWEGGGDGASSLRVELPGWFVGLVWTLLFAGLGAARWLVTRAPTVDADRGARLVVVLLAVCALYPFYALASTSRVPGLIGNLVTIALAVWTARRIRASSGLAAALVGLVAAWVVFATVITDWFA